MTITTPEQLRELYGWPSGRAKDKVISQLEKHTINFIKKSPFFVLSTYGEDGRADASPRGGKAGFVKLIDDSTIIFPDAKGNNIVDSLMNIVDTGRVGCLFFIPGIDETLRLNGKATISTDPTYIKMFSEERIPVKSCVIVEIDELFLHCAKAFMRSKLWTNTYRVERPGFPTLGQMLNDQLGATGPLESQEDMVKRYKKNL
ncbi:pyridoxamine 5'-phosphate oxidase family protein [Saprospiraceae bacterium]|nr:pyridoxamine 5'-phosphate oxidase family protein [Saprospiraceae bacterium]